MGMSQAFVYKPNHTPELHDKDVADRMKAEEGWFDNPKCEKSEAQELQELQELREENAKLESDAVAAAKKPAAKKSAAKKSAE